MISVRKYLSIDDLMDHLEKNKNLIYTSEESKNKFRMYLTQYNYNFFVKGLKNDLMFDENGKYKKEFNSDQIRYLFDIDRRMSSILFKYLKSFEYLLNNSFTAVISKEIFKITETPYLAALTKDEFSNIFANYTKIYRKEWSTSYDIYLSIIDEFYKNFKQTYFLNQNTYRNKDSENEQVLKKIENNWFANDRTYLKNCKESKRNWIYAEIFSITYLLNFNQITRLIKSLNNDLKNQVIKYFCKDFNKLDKKIKITEKTFDMIIDIFSNLRNILAHNSNAIKFRYEYKEDDHTFNVSKLLGYKKLPTENGEIVLKIKDAIAIIEKFIGADTKKIEKEIIEDIKNKSDSSSEKGNDVSDLLLEIIEDETNIKVKD